MVRLTNEEQTAMMVFRRMPRFMEGYNIMDELKNLLSEFKDIPNLQISGLKKEYQNLKNKVIQEKKIGLIIYGLTLCDLNDYHYGIYQTENQNTFNLSIKSICYYLRNEYFDNHEIKDLCMTTPNFDIYYNQFKF